MISVLISTHACLSYCISGNGSIVLFQNISQYKYIWFLKHLSILTFTCLQWNRVICITVHLTIANEIPIRWVRDNLQTIFFYKKGVLFTCKFNWNCFLCVQFTIIQHNAAFVRIMTWRWPMTSHYMNQQWICSLIHICVTRHWGVSPPFTVRRKSPKSRFVWKF